MLRNLGFGVRGQGLGSRGQGSGVWDQSFGWLVGRLKNTNASGLGKGRAKQQTV